MDLNADVGESFGAYSIGDDDALLAVVTSANIACGFHAGDPVVMVRTVRTALEHGVAVGAHVGYPDLQGFGRRAMAIAPEELSACVTYQLGALEGIARSLGTSVRHVKAHGALYNTAAVDVDVAGALVEGVRAFDARLPVLSLPGSAVAACCADAGMRAVSECFADRAYTASGTLVPRSEPGAVIDDPDAVVARALAMATTGTVEAIDGTSVAVPADSMCVHGDTAGAALLAEMIRDALVEAGVELRSFG
jgi:5-oxoprolinase (ATP-hydrolysing) subunit A